MKVFFAERHHHGSELVVENSFKKVPCQVYLVLSIKLNQDITTITCLCISHYPEESVNSGMLSSVRTHFWRCHRTHSCSQNISSFARSPRSPGEDAFL